MIWDLSRCDAETCIRVSVYIIIRFKTVINISDITAFYLQMKREAKVPDLQLLVSPDRTLSQPSTIT